MSKNIENINLDQKTLLEILQEAYYKGEKAVVTDSPKQLIDEMALRLKAAQEKLENKSI